MYILETVDICGYLVKYLLSSCVASVFSMYVFQLQKLQIAVINQHLSVILSNVYKGINTFG